MNEDAAAAPTRLLTALLVLAGVVVLAAAAFVLIVYPHLRSGGEGRRVVYAPPAEGTVRAAAEALGTAGVIRLPAAFAAHVRLRGLAPRLRRHAVVLRDDMTVAEVLARVAEGQGAAAARVVIPEGFDRFQIAERLEALEVCAAREFLELTQADEGYLFPDTYEFAVPSDPRTVRVTMLENFRRRTRALFEPLPAHAAALGWDAGDLVTLASIVEEEARVPEEQATIAGVFVNRLVDPAFRPKRLQADPTVTYGCRVLHPRPPSCTGGGHITRAMLEDASNAYNTYRHEGLPPGPIGNPGLGALRAAAAPTAHRYIYFVATGGGRHTFSETLGDHNRAVFAPRSPAGARAADGAADGAEAP